MKILYDHQVFESYKVGGIPRYFFELLRYLDLHKAIDFELPILYSSNEHLLSYEPFRKKIKGSSDFYNDFMGGLDFKGKWWLFNLYKRRLMPNGHHAQNQKLTIQRLKEGDFDIFHPTNYDTYFLDHIGNKPYVITHYDMIFEIFPEYFSLRDKTAANKKILMQHAHSIISISERSKQDLVDYYGIAPEKIKVIYLANSLNPNEASPVDPPVPEKYILYVGTRPIYKNFYFFIQSVAELLHKDKELHVVCTGKAFSADELFFLDKLGVSKQVHNRYVNDASLAHLYKKARVFIFPSLYEGFGIPILEAFSCSCPVALSNASCLPEIAGEAAVYFDPKNARSIIDSVSRIIYDAETARQFVEKGHQRLKNFSWEKMALETLNFYKDALESARNGNS